MKKMFTETNNRSMGTQRAAFTLIELLISISILSILMLALYKAYDSLNISNNTYKEKSKKIENMTLKKRTIYLDFALVLKSDSNSSVNYLTRDTKRDIVSFQSANSIHKRYNPYITYITKYDKLYRIETLQKVDVYPLASDLVADIDEIGSIDKFKVFKSKKNESYLIDVRFNDEDNILLKVKILNQI